MWREQIPLLKQAKHVTAFEFDKKLYETVLTRVDTLYVAFSAEVVVYCVCVCVHVCAAAWSFLLTSTRR